MHDLGNDLLLNHAACQSIKYVKYTQHYDFLMREETHDTGIF